MISWDINITPRHTLFACLLLVSLILAVYYPALLSGIHSVDDPGIVNLYSSSPPLSQILLPGHGYYYRPLLELTFWLDNALWGMEPRVMHLENILLHCLNTLLVFLLARTACRGQGDGVSFWAGILAAVVFALHPVNVEAVAWIAGRSDLLLTLFALAAWFVWLRWLSSPRWRDLALALLLLLAALLTKETALAAGGVFLLLALVWAGAASLRQRAGALGLMAAPALLVVLTALLFHSGTSALSRFSSATALRQWRALGDALVALGFYAGKLVWPLPLNFAITEADPRLAFLGALLLPALAWLFVRRRVAAAWFAAALLMVLPAVLVAVNQVAWTPYAERYLYLPCACSAVAVAPLVPMRLQASRPLLWALLGVLVLSCSAVDLKRTLLWQDKPAFFEEAVRRSPGFGSVYNELGGQLLQHDRVPEAAEAFATAQRFNKRESMRLLIKANLLGVAFAREDYLGVRTQFFQTFKTKQEANADFLELLQKADSRRLTTLSGEKKVALTLDILETLDLLGKKRYDPFWFYRSGQLCLAIGDKARAAEFFSRAYRLAPADSHYRQPAALYLRKLGSVP
ncbi:tetratricopeptide repeat protein [Geomonas anaerohicana]|uniref:Glycosyltransferase RgtA/B/C/D-like domain-containing protein n=1 Tax=Geomonas anaerohicana TaxID=2798583 RepID=A0ABS0YGM2_9BACT|nr:hypothetical protein [Geomonas anaerohicana]MBJ6751445.1 hypothetical protein [Geomonas anaerohicana]